MTIETARLVLRPVAPDDHAILHALFTQPGVRRFVFDDEIIPPAVTSDIIHKSTELFRLRSFGLWLAERRAHDMRPAGFGALWYFREPPELELLYGVADDERKKGYGREIARAIVEYGFTTLGMAEIRASTDAAHHESRRLLEDLGFVFTRQAIVAGLDTVFYTRTR